MMHMLQFSSITYLFLTLSVAAPIPQVKKPPDCFGCYDGQNPAFSPGSSYGFSNWRIKPKTSADWGKTFHKLGFPDNSDSQDQKKEDGVSSSSLGTNFYSSGSQNQQQSGSKNTNQPFPVSASGGGGGGGSDGSGSSGGGNNGNVGSASTNTPSSSGDKPKKGGQLFSWDTPFQDPGRTGQVVTENTLSALAKQQLIDPLASSSSTGSSSGTGTSSAASGTPSPTPAASQKTPPVPASPPANEPNGQERRIDTEDNNVEKPVCPAACLYAAQTQGLTPDESIALQKICSGDPCTSNVSLALVGRMILLNRY